MVFLKFLKFCVALEAKSQTNQKNGYLDNPACGLNQAFQFFTKIFSREFFLVLVRHPTTHPKVLFLISRMHCQIKKNWLVKCPLLGHLLCPSSGQKGKKSMQLDFAQKKLKESFNNVQRRTEKFLGVWASYSGATPDVGMK